ncbi:MAG: zinc-ribbon domain-containing protein [Blastocatellia bacterium]
MQPMSRPEVRWGEWIGAGWQMFVDRWQVWVLQMLIMFALFAVPLVPFYGMMFAAQLGAAQSGAPPEPPVFMIPFMFIMVPLMIGGMAFLWAGFWKTALKQVRGEPISVRDMFSGGDVFLRVVGAIIAVGILTLIGAIACILPAFAVMGMLFFTLPILIDKDLDISSAISMSYELTKQNWLMFTLFALVVSILASIGQVACYVGLLVTYPLQFTIVAAAYRDLFGVSGRQMVAAYPEPPNYAEQPWASRIPDQPIAPPSPPPSVVESPTMPFCPNCRTPITRVSRFCNQCGSPLDL